MAPHSHHARIQALQAFHDEAARLFALLTQQRLRILHEEESAGSSTPDAQFGTVIACALGYAAHARNTARAMLGSCAQDATLLDAPEQIRAFKAALSSMTMIYVLVGDAPVGPDGPSTLERLAHGKPAW